MAGHSKWANIKHRKQDVDAKRSRLFQKLTKELQSASRSGTDPKKNALLKAILLKAKAANMSKAAIMRALKAPTLSEGNDIFWIAGCFAKKVFIFFEINDQQKIRATNQLKDIVRKGHIEILSNVSLQHFFTFVIVFVLTNIKDYVVEEILDIFSLLDFSFDAEEKKATFYFESSKEAKKFNDYAKNNELEILKSHQSYLPKMKVALEIKLKKELMSFYCKILKLTSCVYIVDNLSKSDE